MRVRLLFFALYRDLLGTAETTAELPAGSTVATLVEWLRARDNGFDRLPPAPAVAVNLEYVSSDHPLQDGDEVAFLPPVAGG